MAALACSALVLALFASPQEETRAAGDPLGPHVFPFEVGTDRVRALGWAPAGATEAEALAAAACVVEWRLRAWAALGDVLVDEEHTRILVRPDSPFTDDERAAFTTAIASLGLLEMMPVADSSLLSDLGAHLATERSKLEAWAARNPGAPILRFDLVPESEGGPHPRIAWYPSGIRTGESPDVGESELERAVPVVLPATLDDAFGAGQFARVSFTRDSQGYPAIGFELRPDRAKAFGDFTERHAGRFLAFVLRGEVVSAPRIEKRLPGGGILRGRWKDAEVREVVSALRAQEGPLRPVE